MNKHTPGPWVYFEQEESVFWGEIRNTEIFDLIAKQPESDDREADFRLMAASPVMLEALQMIEVHIAGGWPAPVWSAEQLIQIERAILDATGESTDV